MFSDKNKFLFLFLNEKLEIYSFFKNQDNFYIKNQLKLQLFFS